MQENKREKFLRVYANVPEGVRNDIIVVVDEKIYTWDTAYFEVKNNTKLGERIIKELEVIGII